MIAWVNVLLLGCWVSCLCFSTSFGVDFASIMSKPTDEERQALHDDLLQLQRDLVEKGQILDAKLSGAVYWSDQSIRQSQPSKTVYISREKKLIKFGGKPSKPSDLTAEEWIEEDHLRKDPLRKDHLSERSLDRYRGRGSTC
jgi:hypothetical protein